MDHDPTRLLRLRWESNHEPGSPAPISAPVAASALRGTPRFLGQVVNGGAMPTGTGRVYLVNPVRLSGGELEGVPASPAVDGTRMVPVVVIGNSTPRVGDFLVALAVGSRWVAESGATPPPLPCSPCNIPKRNLTLSWTNSQLGNGSAALVFTPPGQWNSGCTNHLLFSLSCPGSLIQFTVTYFLSGSCPTGQSQSCNSPGHEPFALFLASYNCAPFFLQYTVTGASCPVLGSNGYSSFTITE
jgi:hypothetical protein